MSAHQGLFGCGEGFSGGGFQLHSANGNDQQFAQICFVVNNQDVWGVSTHNQIVLLELSVRVSKGYHKAGPIRAIFKIQGGLIGLAELPAKIEA